MEWVLGGLLVAFGLMSLSALLIAWFCLKRLGELQKEIAGKDAQQAQAKPEEKTSPEPVAEATPPVPPESTEAPPPLPKETTLPELPPALPEVPIAKKEAPPPLPSKDDSPPPPAPISRTPASEKDNEVRIASWLAARTGITLAVLAVIFFGVYVGQNATPAIRFLELLGISGGITLLGLWLSRKMPTFGRILHGGGLAMLYFTAYAAHAVEGVRVLESAGAGMAAQMLVIVLILFSALQRERPNLAILSLTLGFLSCHVSMNHGLYEATLLSALGLAAIASVLYGVRGWHVCQIITLPLAYFVQAHMHFQLADDTLPALFLLELYPAGIFLFTIAGDRLSLHRECLASQPVRMLIHLMNGFLAIAATWVIMSTYHPEHMSWFFCIAMVLMFSLAALMWYHDEIAPLRTFYFVMGSALATLFILYAYEGQARWLGLLAAAFIILAVSVPMRSRWIDATITLIWLCTAGLFIADHADGGRQAFPHADSFAALGWVLLSSVLFSLRANLRYRLAGFKGSCLTALFLLFGLVPYLNSLSDYFHPSALAAPLAALALLFMLAGLLMRHTAPWAGAVVTLLAGHWYVFSSPYGGSEFYLWGAIALFVLTLRFTYSFGQTPLGKRTSGRTIDSLLHTAWLLGLSTLLFKEIPAAWYVLVSCLLLFILTAISLRIRFGQLHLVLPILGFSTLVRFTYWHGWADYPDFASQEILLWTALALVFAAVCLYSTQLEKHFPCPVRQERTVGRSFMAGLLFACVYAFSPILPTPPWGAVLASALALCAVFGRSHFKLKGLAGIGLSVLAIEHIRMYPVIFGAGSANRTAMLVACLFLVCMSLLSARLAGRNYQAGAKRVLECLAGVFSLLLLFVFFDSDRWDFDHYLTMLWGVSALGLFIAGVIFASKAWRLTALGGLALCLPRMFIFDIQETLHRIIAFGVVAVVLLLIAFLYQKLGKLFNNSTS